MLPRSSKVQMAHDALRWPDKELIIKMLDSVNISPFERQLIIDCELSKKSLKELADIHCMSYSSIVRHKRKAMSVIADYLLNKTS